MKSAVLAVGQKNAGTDFVFRVIEMRQTEAGVLIYEQACGYVGFGEKRRYRIQGFWYAPACDLKSRDEHRGDIVAFHENNSFKMKDISIDLAATDAEEAKNDAKHAKRYARIERAKAVLAALELDYEVTHNGDIIDQDKKVRSVLSFEQMLTK